MKTASVFSVDPFAYGADSKFYFNVVIIYDKKESALRAKLIFDRLMARFGDQFYIQSDFWRFDVLELPEAQDQAVWAGQVANLIIVASQSGETSMAVKSWLEKCVARKSGGPSALVELFHGRDAGGVQPEISDFLKPFASGADFFVHEMEPPVSRIESYGAAPASSRLAWSAPSRGWGINE